ncbi:hypothetical protein [Janthinobacterium sp. BJB401]|uniref:hypothetical protein n=1 Tax=Janthinobacterium sp. BJB401 TaxID=2745934 RepID=UPI001596203E|nr:hypothetical protein [Janthinobacterium sp. BJB401]NVI82501.1 hypothetical protein [Janthinobacterium sp. BJB401]
MALALYRHQSIREVQDDLNLALRDLQTPGVLGEDGLELLHGAAFGPYGTNEMQYAKELLPSIPDHSLTALDKSFMSAEIRC